MVSFRAAVVIALAASACARAAAREAPPAAYRNPHPVTLQRPLVRPLSAVALVGRELFFDPALSASATISCASCHDPANAYGPHGATPRLLAGAHVAAEVSRAVPSLRYLASAPEFLIGPDDGTENVDLVALANAARNVNRGAKNPASLVMPMVPQGGLFWDGRASTLQDQAMGPLMNRSEMGNRSITTIAATLRARYGAALSRLFGESVLRDTTRLVDEALFALARYQVEDSSFHPYRSKYDAWLEGKAALTPAEWRGLQVFDDSGRGNCAACHRDQPSPDGTPPRFTDGQYEALGVPRNRALAPNRDASYFDLGICGPVRTDLRNETQYCGMFATPTLRNVATRSTFFHNGAYTTLEEVVRFYNLRDVDPDSVYPRRAGRASHFDDLPAQYRRNIDTVDVPFGRRDTPRMTDQDLRDLVAFLRTLTDQ